MKFLGLTIAACIAAPAVALSDLPPLNVARTPEAVLSYLFTGNFPEIPSGRAKEGKEPIEYTEKGFIYDGTVEVTFDASDPCRPRGQQKVNGSDWGTFVLDMKRFVTAFDPIGAEGPSLMFFSGEQCPMSPVRPDGETTQVDLCRGMNMLSFYTTLLGNQVEIDDEEGFGHFRNQRLKLAADFYKTEYCEPVPSF